VKWESTLNTNTKANFTNSKSLTGTLARKTNDVALEDLLTSTIALDDTIVNLYIVTNANLRNVLANLLALDGTNVVHGILVSRGAATA